MVQMQKLMGNLIGNSLKFCKEGVAPFVKIYGRLCSTPEKTDDPDGAYFRIFVEDKGIGFDDKYLDRIFKPFERLHGRTKYEGTGIGLAICRKIVERHGGGITARSAPGKGATFIVSLPVNQPKGGKRC